MATVHKWEKYSLNSNTSKNTSYSKTNFVSKTYTSSQSTMLYYSDDYLNISNQCSLNELYYMEEKPTYIKYGGVIYELAQVTYSGDSYTASGYKVTLTTTYSKGGTSYGQVESEDANAYPENGKHTDDYWYVYVGSEEIADAGLFATLDGVQKKLTSLPAMVDGVQKELTSLLATVDGVAREIFASVKSYDPVFANNSWADIIEACQTDNVPDTWAVGDQKPMLINGIEYPIDIIGKNHDELTDGSGYAPLTLQMHYLYETNMMMHSTSTNSIGWTSCDMRLTHLPGIMGLMPPEVQKGLRKVNKISSKGNQISELETTADKLFLLSEVEVFNTTSRSFAGEGRQYAYYANGNPAEKGKLSGSNNNLWWLRSPAIKNKTGFAAVSIYASASGNQSSIECGVSFAFCFRGSSGGQLISFTIYGTSYQAEDGMTWGEWIASEYNVDGYNNTTGSNPNRIYHATYAAYVGRTGTSTEVSINEAIEANGSYTLLG